MFPLKFVIYGQVDHLLNLLLWAAKEKRKNINDENHTKKRNHAEKRNQKKQKKKKKKVT